MSAPLTQQIKDGFSDVAAAFDMTWELHDTRQPMRVLLMVSSMTIAATCCTATTRARST